MNIASKNRNLALSGLLLAVGILLPFVTGHAFALEGTVLLPMHYSVLIAGFLLGPVYGLLLGVITPVLSSLLTGMPVFFPMLPVMVCELAVYGFLTGLLFRRTQKLWLSLIPAMLAGRTVHAAVFAALLLVQNKAVTSAAVLSFLIEGIPGTVLQLILIPLVLAAVKKNHKSLGSYGTSDKE